MLNRLRVWRLKRLGFTTGEFDQLEQLVEAGRQGVSPGGMISKPDAKRLADRGFAIQLDDGRRVATGMGRLAWCSIGFTPRRDGIWLRVL